MANGSMTLLEMTQNILSAMDSDDVNSISDTEESWQVATVIVETYFEQFANRVIPEQQGLLALTNGGDPAIPTWLIIPQSYNLIEWIKYDTQLQGLGSYTDVKYLDPQQFIFNTNRSAISGQPNTQTVTIPIPNGGNFTYAVFDNIAPTWWTSFDDQNLYFDSFNAGLETTLTAANCLAWGQTALSFDMTDSTVPTLDQNLFPLLLAEAKSVCFNDFKQAPNAKEEQKSKRQQQRSQKFLWKAMQRQRQNGEHGYDMPNYSRVPK